MINVTHIADHAVGIGANGSCRHRHIVLDPSAKTIKCDDCGAYLEPFETLMNLKRAIDRTMEGIKEERHKLLELREQNRHLLAARQAEKAWQSRTTVPVCPHCHEPIFADDGFGSARMGREMAKLKRERRQEKG